jgi:hypothetical protein
MGKRDPLDRRDQFANPAGWPEDVVPLFEHAITCEFATVTRAGTPVTLPLTPYVGADGRTLDVSTGLTYPAKAERVRRNPNVCMLFSNPLGSGLVNAPVALVYGLGAVRDGDLQANADRYIQLSRRKLPGLYSQLPWFILKRQRWYWSRIWLLTTPRTILWWPGGRTDEAPLRWEAPQPAVPLASDPAPAGHQPPPWQPARADWRPRAAYAARHLGVPVLTVTDGEGFAVPVRARAAERTADGFRLVLPTWLPAPVRGPACLTFHDHDARFAREENATFAGSVAPSDDGRASFTVERALGDLSAPGSLPRRVWAVFSTRRRLLPRLAAEAERRGQPIPLIRLPPGG